MIAPYVSCKGGPSPVDQTVYGLSMRDSLRPCPGPVRLTADGLLQESLGGRADYAAAEEEEEGDEAGDAEDAGGGGGAGGWQGVQYAAAGALRSGADGAGRTRFSACAFFAQYSHTSGMLCMGVAAMLLHWHQHR